MRISIWRFLKGQLVRNNPGGFRAIVMNQFGQVSVIGFDIRLTRSHALSFGEKCSEIKSHLSLLSRFVGGTRVLLDKNAFNTQLPGRFYRLDQFVHRHVGDFMPGRIVALITHALIVLPDQKLPD